MVKGGLKGDKSKVVTIMKEASNHERGKHTQKLQDFSY